MTGVPPNADILAAFLYWETITTNIAQVDGAKFRGQDVSVVKTAKQVLTSELSQCWTSGEEPVRVHVEHVPRRVLRFLPEQLDVDGKTTGRRLVNDDDLLSAGFERHTVTLPEAGSGNLAPQSAGASLFVLFRDLASPLTKVVVYDGAYAQPKGVTMTQTLRGFLQSSANPQAKITHIIGSGGASDTDRLWFTGVGPRTLISSNPVAHTSPGSDRGWSNPTYDVSSLMTGIGPDHVNFGQQVVTELDHTSSSPDDCLTWAAIIFSTTVADRDKDGLIDRLEDSTIEMKEPNGAPLPRLNAMGASSTVRDLFIEVGAMKALPGTTYGSADAPFSPTLDQAVDPVGHTHVPNPAVVKTLGDSFRKAPVINTYEPVDSPWRTGIRLHMDLGPAYVAGVAADYVVPATLARGGEEITEVACVSEGCQFPDYAGTVSYKIGTQIYRDAPVGPEGQELLPDAQEAQEAACENSATHSPTPAAFASTAAGGICFTMHSTRTRVVCRKRSVCCRTAQKIKSAV